MTHTVAFARGSYPMAFSWWICGTRGAQFAARNETRLTLELSGGVNWAIEHSSKRGMGERRVRKRRAVGLDHYKHNEQWAKQCERCCPRLHQSRTIQKRQPDRTDICAHRSTRVKDRSRHRLWLGRLFQESTWLSPNRSAWSPTRTWTRPPGRRPFRTRWSEAQREARCLSTLRSDKSRRLLMRMRRKQK